jgi:large subunit ribosomal protein L22
MADETPDKPKRRRRRKAAPEDVSASEAQSVTETEGGATASDASASEPDVSSEPSADEVTPSAADSEAADEAADVVLEAEDEVDADTDAEVAEATESAAEEPPAKPSRRPRRRQSSEAEEAPPPRPAPTRRRAPQRDPSLPPPVVRAQAKYVRSSARKARLVCDPIRGKAVDEARAILAVTPRAVARDWSKLLESAVANAENNHDLIGDDLYIKAVHADEGPTIKRFRPRALGRATRIRKRTSHLTILLTPKE